MTDWPCCLGFDFYSRLCYRDGVMISDHQMTEYNFIPYTLRHQVFIISEVFGVKESYAL